MIEIKTLHIKNFLSHTNSEIDFDDVQGLTLILGKNSDGRYDSNGSGKSTILEAIVYALTGHTLRGVAVDEVVNRNVGADTEVKLVFSQNGEEYTIIRYRKHAQYANKVLFFQGDEELTKKNVKDTQDIINQVIGIPRDILESMIFMGEGLSSRFTLLNDTERKALIESTLALDYDFDKLKAQARQEQNNVNLKRSQHQGNIDATKTHLSVLEDQETISEDDLAALEKEFNLLEDESSSLTDQQNQTTLMLQTLVNSINQANQINQDIAQQEQVIEQLTLQVEQLKNQESPICPVCHQEISDEQNLTQTLSHYQSQINNAREVSNDLAAILSNIPDSKQMEDKVIELKERNDTLLEQLRTLNNKHNSLQRQISAGQEKISLQAKLGELKKSLEESERSIKKIEKDYQDYQYIYDMFSPKGLITHILNNSIQYINQQLRQYTTILIDREYQLDLVKSKIVLVDKSGSTYQSLSNGEKRRLDISIQFALHDYIYHYCQAKVDILFIDEVLDTLDKTGVDNIFEVLKLKQRACDLKGIYIITHNNDLKEKFDNYIVVEKGLDGNSKLSY